jgi:hypothetical protein
MNEIGTSTPNRQIVINTLAVAGFIALVGASMWLAVYSTRYVPDVVGRLGSAAVYLGSVFTPAEAPTLSVVPTPTASTTISFAEASSTISTSVDIAGTKPAAPKVVVPTAGKKTDNTVQIAGTPAPAALSGLSDLMVKINAVGYLATTSAESFVATSTVPNGSRPAVNFTIKNIGTNVTGAWSFSASIPTQTAYIYQSQPQQSLAPGDSIDYTLGFDQSNKGPGQIIFISANFDRAVSESNFDNNNTSTQVTILGS